VRGKLEFGFPKFIASYEALGRDKILLTIILQYAHSD
jgi:hypothetical protein